MPKRITVTLSDDLHEASELLRRKNRYRTLSEYIQNLVRYDAQSQREHLLTAEWAALSPAERDMLDARLLALVKSGKGVRGSWLEARIEAIVTRIFDERGANMTKAQIVEMLAREIIQDMPKK